MSSVTKSRFFGHGQPVRFSKPMNINITTCMTTATKYAPATTTRSSRECSRPSGNASTRCAIRAADSGAIASPIVNGSAESLSASDPANRLNPVAIISGPVHASGRRRQATNPLPTNESAATSVTAARAVVWSRAAP
jgi:hypothetical protein